MNILDSYFNEGWKEFMKDRRERAKISNNRLFCLLALVRGNVFVHHLQQYMKVRRAQYSTIRILRKPVGYCVTDRRFEPSKQVWVQPGQNALGKYTIVCIQVKENRWIKFTA